MPLSPSHKRKLAAKQAEKRIGLSEADKQAQKKERKEEAGKIKEGEHDSPIPQWAVWILAFMILGSVFTQLYFSILTNPSMSQEH